MAYGYYAHGVGPETAKAPSGWQERLVKRDVPPRAGSDATIVAWCLEVHDLVLSKCAAGRERDWDYAREALRAQIVGPDVLLARIPDLPVSDAVIAHVDTMVQATIDAAEAASGHS